MTNALTVGTMLLASKVIDAVTDLTAGYIIDKTHTRWGKARPYEIFIIFEWVFTVLMFNVPDGSKTLQYIWVFVMYVLVNAVRATMLGAADSVYLARTFTTDNNRIKIMSMQGGKTACRGFTAGAHGYLTTHGCNAMMMKKE